MSVIRLCGIYIIFKNWLGLWYDMVYCCLGVVSLFVVVIAVKKMILRQGSGFNVKCGLRHPSVRGGRKFGKTCDGYRVPRLRG